MYQRPTFQDVLKARAVITGYLSRTPLYRYASLCQLLGCEVYVKHENHQPVGAFKVRGGINLVSQLSDDERRRGVVTASTGNHGQSVAYAARLFGVEATIVVPEGANPGKVEAMRGLGAHIIFHGRDFDEARERCEALALDQGYRYIHAGNEPLLIAGVGTETLEVMEDQPDIEVIIVPIGGGSGASGACIVAKAINPAIQVIGAQAEQAPAAYRSWKARRLVEDKMETMAEGLATRTAFALPQSILWGLLDDFVLVSEEEIYRAIVLYLQKTHNLAEGAGAAPLAAAMKMRERLRGCKVALILSGGNLSLEQLRVALGSQRESRRMEFAV
jgi:threonine dehydratase